MQSNATGPYISICIPAFQRAGYLTRLLESIAIQDYRHFEVVISDDSRDDTVAALAAEWSAKFPVRYLRNQPSLGTPSNWNAAIGNASGDWIKLMHDDDWFSRPDALRIFAEATSQGNHFIFSDYINRFEKAGDHIEKVPLTGTWKKRILAEPMTLLAYNVIGPPSVTMVHRSITEQYDERLKWRVDMEYYVRLLKQEKAFTFLPEILVSVGISDSQVTQSCLYQPPVELPEGKLLLEKHGVAALRNVWVYDAWWRLLRNMKILKPEQLEAYAPGKWPEAILRLQEDLSGSPGSWLQHGLLSKALMFLSYLKHGKKA
ncbi:glycosyltransferase family 2 protein [Flavihumibacter petaseus]|nr:glycosyltransferase [Flavihumibacter petaseus]